jgi:hypothetical protein
MGINDFLAGRGCCSRAGDVDSYRTRLIEAGLEVTVQEFGQRETAVMRCSGPGSHRSGPYGTRRCVCRSPGSRLRASARRVCTRCAPAPGRRHIAAGPPAGLSSDLPKVETNGKPGRQASRSTRGTCVARRTDRIRMVAAMADATAAMAHAAIEAAGPGLFVIKYSSATTCDEPKKTE